MLEETKVQLIKRGKSFLWRLGCFMALAGLNFISEQMVSLSLPTWALGLVGLVVSEATKWINTNTNLFGGIKK